MKQAKQTVSQVKFLMSEWDTETNEQHGIFPNALGSQSNKYAFWKCKHGHKWKAKINNRFNGRGCPMCVKRVKTSFPEQAVYFYVKKKFPDAINSYRDIFKKRMELDVYIPSIKVGIEYDGIQWHKDETLEKEKRKYDICRRNGIFLYRLKENLNHYHAKLDVADSIIPVGNCFTGRNGDYQHLDYAIRVLLHQLFDYDVSDLLVNKTIEESLQEAVFGPKINTDVNTKRDRNLIYENYIVTLDKNSLELLFPEIAKKWNPTKNGELKPSMFSPHSNFKAWWLGECGHEWDNKISLVTRGQGCPYCSGKRVLIGFNDLASRFPKIADQWHPTLNGNKTPDLFTSGSGHVAHWLCPVCGQTWRSSINMRSYHGRGCPYCAHEKPIKGINDLATLRPDLMIEWDYDQNKNINPGDLMPNSNKKVWWKCSQCGYKYKAYVANRNKGTQCKMCAGQILIQGLNDLQTKYPNIAKEWDTELNGNLKPNQIFPQTNKKYHWICSVGHKWEASPNSRIHGRGCPFCSGNKVMTGFNDLSTTHPKIAEQWHPTMNGNLKPTQVSKGHKTKVWFLCDKCGKPYDSYISNKIKGYGKCPYCCNHKSRVQRVLLVETGETFKTLREAALAVGKEDFRQIQMCCKGKCKTAFGYHWKYIHNNN